MHAQACEYLKPTHNCIAQVMVKSFRVIEVVLNFMSKKFTLYKVTKGTVFLKTCSGLACSEAII